MMAEIASTPSDAIRRLHGGLRIRTLALIRWIAVAGQLATLLVVHFGLRYPLPLVPALAAVAALAALNFWSSIGQQRRKRLSDRAATLSLAFDVLQLSALLFLMGGLENPFALMVLAPVTIAATILSPRGTLAVGVVAAVCVSALALWHMPLPWRGTPLAIPPDYVFGIWVALILSTGLLSAYNWSLAEEARRMADALNATQMALAREQNISALGMLAASIAHQLGSPLGTIAVVSKEIANDLPSDSPLAEDAALLLSEIRRCRQILAGLGERPEKPEGSPFARLPFTALVEAAAGIHRSNRSEIAVESGAAPGFEGLPVPMVAHSPEIIHGLESLIQNAVQFAYSRVTVSTFWTDEEVTVRVEDDGPGFAPHILSMIGEPYVSSRRSAGGHMGLGIFIAQTLLEHTGAVLSFGNRSEPGEGVSGAVVTVRWRRPALEQVAA
jgi:two-component system sensor histidine kinase RegB